MRAAISNTAEFGIDHAAGRLVDDRVRAEMRTLLAEIRDGRFADRLKSDADAGFPELRRHRDETADHEIESAGRAVRDLMPWLAEDDAKSEASAPSMADEDRQS